MSNYEQLKKSTWETYSKIGHIMCPVLGNEKIFFNEAGFDHLLRKGKVPRTRKDQARRLLLLKHVRTILQSKTAMISVHKHQKVLFWAVEDQTGNRIIRVVIIQSKDGIKHFLSIMDYYL